MLSEPTAWASQSCFGTNCEMTCLLSFLIGCTHLHNWWCILQSLQSSQDSGRRRRRRRRKRGGVSKRWCFMLKTATPCCMLLDVVVQSLKPVKLFSQQLPTFLLFRDRRSIAQQCWIRLHSSSHIVSLSGRRSKGKGKGIRARDHTLARPNSPFLFPF